MKQLNWYITKNFLISFGMSIGILTFCMVGGRLVPVMEYVAKGVPISTFWHFIVYCMPIVLTFTIPLSVMVSVMLVFGRLSADSEITAMRACGISILQLISPIMIITVILTGLCLYLQVQVGPPMLEKARELFKDTLIDTPEAFFQPGIPLSFEGNVIYVSDVDNKDKNNIELIGVQVFRQEGDNLTDIQSDSGRIEVDREREEFKVILSNARIFHSTVDENFYVLPDDQKKSDVVLAFNYGKARNQRAVSQRMKFMTLRNLMASIRIEKIANGPNRDTNVCEMEVELNQRIAFALAPIAFMLLGIPLAIHTSRRETSVGLFIGALAGGFFFLAIILCESLASYPNLYPQYLLWLPNLGYQIAGAIMVYRITRK